MKPTASTKSEKRGEREGLRQRVYDAVSNFCGHKGEPDADGECPKCYAITDEVLRALAMHEETHTTSSVGVAPLTVKADLEHPRKDTGGESTEDYPGQAFFHEHNPRIARAERAMHEETPARERKEYRHWGWCNGDRRVPAGEPGHSCCCFNAVSVGKGLVGPALYLLPEKWRKESDQDGFIVTGILHCADELEAALRHEETSMGERPAALREKVYDAVSNFCQHGGEPDANGDCPTCYKITDEVLESALAGKVGERPAPSGGEVE